MTAIFLGFAQSIDHAITSLLRMLQVVQHLSDKIVEEKALARCLLLEEHIKTLQEVCTATFVRFRRSYSYHHHSTAHMVRTIFAAICNICTNI